MIKLSLKQAVAIRDNDYKLTGRRLKLPIDTYDGVTYSREELDQHIFKLQSNVDAKNEAIELKAQLAYEKLIANKLKALKQVFKLCGDSKELRTMIITAKTEAELYYI